MSEVKIQVTAAFIYDKKHVEVGDIITVTKSFASEMVHANKAVRVKPEPKPVTPPRAEPAPLAAQTVPVETPEGGSGGRRTRT